jgi:DNA-binding MarR family transcriptional regulator
MGSRPRKLGRSETSHHVDYWTLAELRYSIRRFLRTREVAARAAGIAPQQYLLLLQLKGLEGRRRTTIGVLAERLQLHHHTTVELVDRLANEKLVTREPEGREVMVKLLPAGEALLKKLATYSITELQTDGPALVSVLKRLIRQNKRPG